MLHKILILIVLGALVGACAARTPGAGGKNEAASSSQALEYAGELKTAASSTAYPDGHDFIIGPGDIVDISVWKDEELTRSCVVRPDGILTFPLIGDVRAGGRTASELKAEMEEKLKSYVPDLVLTVEVKQVNSMIIYVIGKVNAPGRFVMHTNINVLQALATAGGLNAFAKGNKIKIFRQQKGETVIMPFEYDEIVDGRRLEQNVMLKAGDVVVVP